MIVRRRRDCRHIRQFVVAYEQAANPRAIASDIRRQRRRAVHHIYQHS